MKKKFLSVAVLAVIVCTGTWLTSCNNDDDDDKSDTVSTVIAFENVTTVKDFVQSGSFEGKGNAEIKSPVILPGQSLSFTFSAGKGQALMFATMYNYSNDLFFAPENPGIALYDTDGVPVTGDVSDAVKLWDNGTRVNEKPGPAVTHPGVAESGTVSMITDTDAQGNTYAPASKLMKLELAYDKTSSQFTLTMTNTSNGTISQTPFSSGVWTISNVSDGALINKAPLFTPGQKSSMQLTALAETGNEESLKNLVGDATGIITDLSPVVVVVYSGKVNPIYELNKKDGGYGLSELAQKGDPSILKESLAKIPYVKKVYVAGSAAVAPGQKVETQFEAHRDDHISYATMFGYSNDWFFADNTEISVRVKGDVTGKTSLLDDGTAVSQYPGAGNAQAIFGGTPIPEDKVITNVGDTYPVPEVSKLIKVTIR